MTTRPRKLRRLGLVLGPPLVVLVLGVLTLLGVRRERTETGWVAHTQTVRLTLADLLGTLRDAETGQRGYMLVADTSYLAPFTGSRARVGALLDSLRRLTADNDSQRLRVERLAPLATTKLDELTRTINLTAAGQRDSALRIVRGNRGKLTMDSIRALVDTMGRTESRLLDRRLTAAADQASRVVIGVVLGTLLAALFALAVYIVLSRYASERERAVVRLGAQNDRLTEQGLELEVATDRLQEQAIELEAQRDELMATTDALAARTESAEEANRAKALFLTTMSHELRTPLNAIDGYAELLQMGLRGPVTEQQLSDLDRIRRSQRHLLALVNEVLNYARLEAGRVEWHITDVVLADALHSAEALVSPLFEGKQLRYERTGCDEALLVRADGDKPQQILVNLLGNASKFTDPGGTVSLTCERSDACVRVIIRDSGRGIPADKLGSIFDPFVQVDRQLTQTGQQGVGLGLAISRDLARGMGAEITVESEVGKGSAFALVLPIAGGTSMPDA